MKNIYIFLLLTVNAFSQTYKVNYNAKFDLGGTLPKPIEQKINLTTNSNNSLSLKFLISDLNSDSLKISKNKFVKWGSDTLKYFKDFNIQKIYSEELIRNKPFNVVDDLNIFEWNITNETKLILGYTCFKATTTFRGREFVAYFAKDIPIPDGPMKFNGLPGLILEIMMVNSQGMFSAVAKNVVLDNEKIQLKNPFSSAIKYTEFKEKYIKKITELQSYYTGTGTTIGTNGLEILFFDE
jgi:GLPGLI family protein